ncbi:MAG: alpha-glucuronidase family glycosyl hydrolase [Terracidiphilus sp.]
MNKSSFSSSSSPARRFVSGLLLMALLAGATALGAQAPAGNPGPAPLGPGDPAWLAYRTVSSADVFGTGSEIPDTVVVLGQSAMEQSAANELARGWRGMLNRVPRVVKSGNPEAANLAGGAVIVGTQTEVRAWRPELASGATLGADAYKLHRAGNIFLIEGGDARGALYGTFALLRDIAQQHSLRTLDEASQPWAAVRWTDEWDNLNGTIERGYGGPSIFFEDGHVRADLSRAGAYARLLASIGIDGCDINNVNADARLLLPENLKGMARIADVFRPYGVRLALAVDIASPQKIGGLPTFDPLDPRVEAWWREKADEIYRLIPDFGGFTVKADSEGQPGPWQYGRTQADAANVVARALAPHGGLVLYRAFVYNNHLDWRDPKADRARAAYDIFHPLDGKFDSNVVVQIKNGPIDFQVREPISPLFAGLQHTNEAMELQITQEYTGQQLHLVYLAPMWKISLDTDMRASLKSPPLLVRDLLSGRTVGAQHHSLGGFIGVAGVGTERWLGNPLALANLYAFGRLAWNPTLSAASIVDEWTRLTLGNNPEVRAVVNKLQMDSWHIYESYTGPLGLGTLTDILGAHYGPDPQSAEDNGWGQWIRADREGVGMNRTVANGTGYIGQYPAPLAAEYESLKTCPDNLLLFMHHVPYTYKLHSGKTVIQYIYDTHYWGAQAAAAQVPAWESLHGKIPDAFYDEALRRFEYQAGEAVVWRDAVTRFFARTSGIPDDLDRVGNYPGRISAVDMTRDGYASVDAKVWETAMGGKAVECVGREACSLSVVWNTSDGWYNIVVAYYHFRSGASHYTLEVDGHAIDAWTPEIGLPVNRISGSSAMRQTVENVALHRGDTLTLIGRPNGIEPAPVDYIQIAPGRGNPAGRTQEESK